MGSFQVAYKVLETDLLRQTDRERAASIALLVSTDEDAKKLAGHDGFGYKFIDVNNGRAGVITYRGAEIVLLFKRKIMEMNVAPADPVPQNEIKEPNDAWIRINLLDPKVPYFQRTELNKLQGENERLRLLLKAAKVDLDDKTVTATSDRVWKQELQKKNTIIENHLKTIDAYSKDLMGYDEKMRVIQKENALKLAEIAQEVLPAYDTVRMSLEVDPSNKLMLGLQGQLRSMLRNFGCELIEPQVWTKFDPQFHNAVHSYPLMQGDPRIGQIVKIATVGLKKGGVILKAANVAVAVEKKTETGGSDVNQQSANA